LLIFAKDVIYGLGIVAGCALLFAVVASNIYIFYMIVESVVNAYREEHARNKRDGWAGE
jgi:hypothetical protein